MDPSTPGSNSLETDRITVESIYSSILYLGTSIYTEIIPVHCPAVYSSILHCRHESTRPLFNLYSPSQMFHTSRLILRGYRASDEAFFLDLFDTYDVLVYLTSEYIAPSTGTHRARLDKMAKCALFLVVEDMETHERMGFALVDVAAPRHLDGEVGMALAQEWWGQGFATEIMEWLIGYSFRGLGLRRLSLFAFSSNTRAIALYEKVYAFYFFVNLYSENLTDLPVASNMRAGSEKRSGRRESGWIMCGWAC
jgi:RimJ/RimL family protein N-acetyltransferase